MGSAFVPSEFWDQLRSVYPPAPPGLYGGAFPLGGTTIFKYDMKGLKMDDPFDKVLSEIQDINRKKRADYAADSDIFSNFKDVGHQLGATAGTAVEAHIATKQSRLRQLLQPGREPKNESVRDTLLDRAVYSVIALALHDEGLYSSEEQ
jgi:hypothetical protein